MKRATLRISSASIAIALLVFGFGFGFGFGCGAGDSNDDWGSDGKDGAGGTFIPLDPSNPGSENVDYGPGLPITGKVMAPSGAIPVSGALVYLSKTDPPEIPAGAYHYECDEMDGVPYTLSKADGTWQMPKAPYGKWKLITRKGNFRRVRDIEIVDGMVQEIAPELTTLPAKNSDDGRDRIPSFAVVRTSPDLTYNLLAKFGMGQVDASGVLVDGTETFAIYEDEITSSGHPQTQALFASKEVLHSYQMIFLPCSCTSVGISFVKQHAQMLRDYVSAGGRIYNSCTVALWTKAPFPEYITYMGSNALSKFDIGRTSNGPYSTNGTIVDNGLADWMKVVTSEQPTSIPFVKGYVGIKSLNDVSDGHGLDKDGKVVKPYMWVRDNEHHVDSPLMVTYNYDFGKVFYSVYETSSETTAITPQEYILLYVILEVGVCANFPPPPPPK